MPVYKKKFVQKSVLTLLLIFLCVAAAPALAQPYSPSGAITQTLNNLNTFQDSAAPSDQKVPLPELVANIIQVVLGIVGLIFIGLIIYGGYLWGTARGSEERVTTGRRLIFEATIGVIIILGAYFLTAFIVQQIAIATLTPSQQAF